MVTAHTSSEPLEDPHRLRVIQEAGLHKKTADPAFDVFSRLTATTLGVPTAILTVLDGETEVFKSIYGAPQRPSGVRGIPAAESICRLIVQSAQPITLTDVRTMPELADLAVTREFNIVAYAGAPIFAGGVCIGACCAIVSEPRSWSERDVQILQDIAVAASAKIEYRRAVAGREQSAQQFKNMITHAPLAIVVTTVEEARFVEFNERWLDAFGYSRQELLGRTAYEVGLWSDPAQRRHITEELLRTGRVNHAEIQLRTRHGDLRTFEFAASMIEFNGELCALAILSDVTARKAGDEKLRESEERFRQLVEHIPQAFWMRDAATGAVLYLSPAVERLVGIPASKIFESDAVWQDAMHPDDRERVLDVLTNLKTSRYQIEYRMIRPDGAIRWISTLGFPIHDANGKVYRLASRRISRIASWPRRRCMKVKVTTAGSSRRRRTASTCWTSKVVSPKSIPQAKPSWAGPRRASSAIISVKSLRRNRRTMRAYCSKAW